MRKALAIFLFLPALHAQTTSPVEVRAAAQRSVAMVQHSSEGFYQAMTCFSCHAHGLPMLTLQIARQKGIAVDEASAAKVAVKGLMTSPDFTSIDQAVQETMIIDPAPSEGWALIAAHAAGAKPNLVTEVYARRIANWQREDGHWPTFDVRPPQSYSVFTTTTVALRAIQLFLPPQFNPEIEERQARAKNWLLTATPHSTEDFTFRLFGLHYAGGTPEETHRAAQELLALQRTGGGWAELPHSQPDAYSTGEALVALHIAGGVPVTNPEWQKGLSYLLSTRDKQGVWHVHTRQVSPASVSPPYIETGFPYGHDQFISTDAACWAAMAMMLTLPESAHPAEPQPLTALEPKGIQPWIETALFGSAAELKAKLDGGLDPNMATLEGTSLLMMASSDAEKVKLLIDRGANVRAKAKSGYTALMVASTYVGTSDSVKLLLEHGAEVNPGKDVKFHASPFFLASFTGDQNNMALLLAKGADPNRRMDLLGNFPTSPLIGAIGFGNLGIVKSLLADGADIHEKDADNMTPLHWAVVDHHPDVVKALLGGGADVNAVDRYGYTPLLYASTIDFGDAETAKILLQAGADPNVKAKKGETALSQARELPYVRDALDSAASKR
ncbi:MAG TPA: ankyrin repeat domain-containing protein [Terriglobia bacterium]|nr:ankyrin repeat domain-containing protein [Terriglobia bacterium]